MTTTHADYSAIYGPWALVMGGSQSVARAMMDAELRETSADWLCVARIASDQSIDTRVDPAAVYGSLRLSRRSHVS